MQNKKTQRSVSVEPAYFLKTQTSQSHQKNVCRLLECFIQTLCPFWCPTKCVKWAGLEVRKRFTVHDTQWSPDACAIAHCAI